jgi:uncharacterized alpha-E superfamily protein
VYFLGPTASGIAGSSTNDGSVRPIFSRLGFIVWASSSGLRRRPSSSGANPSGRDQLARERRRADHARGIAQLTGDDRHVRAVRRALEMPRERRTQRREQRVTELDEPARHEGRDAVERELWTILFDPECRDGLATVLGNVRRTADAVRERLSFDTFRILRDLTEVPHSWQLSPDRETDDALRLLNRLVQFLAAFNGMVMENMTRGYGWRFLDMGRRLERLRHMIQLIQQLAVRGDPQADGALELLLELADSTMTYRARYRTTPQLPGVLDLLLSDETNPRSAVFQIVTLGEHMTQLPGADEEGILTPDQRITTRLGNELRLADPAELGETVSRFDARIELDRLARRVDRGVHQLSDHIAERFFSHSSPRRVAGVRGDTRR